ncbi:type I-F CRISPR-associated helicase Cas3 [Pseudoalteromonas sp. MSK9-3]|uniref:type I-F CRISPR-associated helicase Cas3f n=1 Tax=Pseudoalteromonas sp. MSK9-3 TaxID=1897633 RepID=UPI000E6BB49E|nr:type I-F CRISPR-associated helicase Cas3f [Pseudoalteromonas sp. MSK9-3]RJE76996.1 type I-F CRISPR-associated helicase Cas3 [Pseudoalteromonas sp. MSK9-3]
MMVTFVSQCEKNALKKTRRVLDAFANRIGDNTWQTLITEDGLLTVKKMLRKTASRSTAVSCHWLRSRSRSQLLWVVGNKSKFNAEGLVPVNSTRNNLLRSELENDWHYLPLIKALAAVTSLLHDWGKSTTLFQEKLKPDSKHKFKGDPIRHEWISLLLLRALVFSCGSKKDTHWLEALSKGAIDETILKNSVCEPVKKPLEGLPPIAKLVAWLVVSHHRLPLPTKDNCKDYLSETAESLDQALDRITQHWGYQNRFDEEDYQKRLLQCFDFPNGLISNSKLWLIQVKKWSARLLLNHEHGIKCIETGSYRLILHHTRLCVMLGDHYYSSQQADKKWKNTTGLFANTDSTTNQLKQKLDEHLVGVMCSALHTAHLLPAFEIEPPLAQDIKSLYKRSPKPFQWQDKAVDKITLWRAQEVAESQKQYGFFTVNMASTGCGKTFANAKVMRALSRDGQSLRFILALGLRTLTLQTGDEYRQRVGLDSTELAVLIGSKAVMELHNSKSIVDEGQVFESSGSSSQDSLLTEEVDFECDIPEKGLATVLTCARDKQFLYAPVLACTIDHIIAATETKRGGRYILPSLRLMSSDLVIDEIDDFTGVDLIAIGRLIHLAGMLGRKVMISSATIPPSLAEGYFKAYRDGWQVYCKTRSANAVIGCAWIDEFTTQVTSNKTQELPDAISQYRKEHTQFIENRVKKLAQQPSLRKADISYCHDIIERYRDQNQQQKSVIEHKQAAYFNIIAQSALNKHSNHHFTDPVSQLNVSFGVVRIANIQPCTELTRYLLEHNWPSNIQVRVMAYHSQQVLLMRSIQEEHLDKVLKRKESPPQALADPVIRNHLNNIKQDNSTVEHIMFILVTTPVEEVGRDHDFDWAVIEPSSYRSIIQLSGRVRRHRSTEVTQPNIALLQYNWKAIKNSHKERSRVFHRPGFESYCNLTSHDLEQLIDVSQAAERLDAIPRIKQPSHINAGYVYRMTVANNLVDLEHASTLHTLAYYTSNKDKGAQTNPASLQGWLNKEWFLTALPQQLAPFRQSEPTLKIFLVFDEYQSESRFCEKDDKGYTVNRESILNIKRVKLSELATSRVWLVRDFDQTCTEFAERISDSYSPLSQRLISLKYGELSFQFNEKYQYAYNDQLGLVKV